MRHLLKDKKFGRAPSHRLAMFRNMVTSLLEHEQIITTSQKAKELRSLAEKMITLGKQGDLASRRQALAVIRKPSVVKSLFDTIAPRYQSKQGGYTRIMRFGFRQGDAASLSMIELIPDEKVRATKLKGLKEAKLKAKEEKDKKSQEERERAQATGTESLPSNEKSAK